MPGRPLENSSNNNNNVDDPNSNEGVNNNGNIPRRSSRDHMRIYHTQGTNAGSSDVTHSIQNGDGHAILQNGENENGTHHTQSENLSDGQGNRYSFEEEITDLTDIHYQLTMGHLRHTDDAIEENSEESGNGTPFESHDPNSQAADLLVRIHDLQEHPEASAAWNTRLQERTRHYQSDGIIPGDMNLEQRREYYSILTQLTHEICEEYNL